MMANNWMMLCNIPLETNKTIQLHIMVSKTFHKHASGRLQTCHTQFMFVRFNLPKYFVAPWYDIDGLMQERRNSTANAVNLRLSCTKPLIYMQHVFVHSYTFLWDVSGW